MSRRAPRRPFRSTSRSSARRSPKGLLHTRPPGYLLELAPDGVDLYRFERLVAEGERRLAGGDPEHASRQLTEALALWRGAALAEFSEPFARVESAHLEELRLSAARGANRGRPGARATCRARRRARHAPSAPPAARAPACPADAHALSGGAPGRGPRLLPGLPPCARRGARHRALGPAARARAADAAAGSGARAGEGSGPARARRR